MTAIGKYCHDFPRLAKESGYCFHLHRGKVDWSEIKDLNIDDVIDNKNFQLLEQNLLNVINCNLDAEYNVKILDQNFVKLFKLAQLGVDYLSYCELYLDRCVILLQEQLAASQEECQLLRDEIEKKDKQLKKNKRKSRLQEEGYRCRKCDKSFISEVYLISHEKRRHSSNPETPKSPEKKKIESTDRSQQTEPEKISSTVSTQTLEPENSEPSLKEKEEMNQLSKEYELKMGNLEKQVGELRERLKSAEKTLTEKNDDFGQSRPYNFPNTFFYPQMIPFVPPYAPQPRYFDVSSGYSTGTQEPVKTTVTNDIPDPGKENSCEKSPVTKSPKLTQNEIPREVSGKKDSSDESLPTTPEKPIKPKVLKSRKKLDFNKENLDPLKQVKEISDIKPIPFPRRPKTLFEMENTSSVTTMVQPFNLFFDEPNLERTSLSSLNSTPVKEIKKTKAYDIKNSLKSKAKNLAKNTEFEESRNKRVRSEESVQDQEIKSKNFFKKMVTKNSPKIQELSKNFKRSLTSLYDSVSASGRDLMRREETVAPAQLEEDTKSDVVEGLNTRLRELGVDPEWSGIPKETMKQKIKTLEHRRNLLARENPSYPSIRKRLEKNLFKKFNKNSSISQEKRSISSDSLQKLDSPERVREADIANNKTPSFEEKENASEKKLSSQRNGMYTLESESESDISDFDEAPVKTDRTNRFLSSQRFPERLEENVQIEPTDTHSLGKTEKTNEDAVRTETDFSIFQIGKSKTAPTSTAPASKTELSSAPSPKKPTFLNTVDELQTDSDFDDTFLKEFEETSLKSITGYLDKRKSPDEKAKETEVRDGAGEKVENQSILKKAQTRQPRPQSTVKKKVLFADYPESKSNVASHSGDRKPATEPTLPKQDRAHVRNLKEDTWSSDSDWDVAQS